MHYNGHIRLEVMLAIDRSSDNCTPTAGLNYTVHLTASSRSYCDASSITWAVMNPSSQYATGVLTAGILK